MRGMVRAVPGPTRSLNMATQLTQLPIEQTRYFAGTTAEEDRLDPTIVEYEVFDIDEIRGYGRFDTFEAAAEEAARANAFQQLPAGYETPSVMMIRVAGVLGHRCASYVSEREAFGLTPAELNVLWDEHVRADWAANPEYAYGVFLGIPSWYDEGGIISWTTGSGRLSIKVTESSVTLACWAGTPPAPSQSPRGLVEQIEWELWGEPLTLDDLGDNCVAEIQYAFDGDGQWTVAVTTFSHLLADGREDRVSFLFELDQSVFGEALLRHLRGHWGDRESGLKDAFRTLAEGAIDIRRAGIEMHLQSKRRYTAETWPWSAPAYDAEITMWAASHELVARYRSLRLVD